jgi:hypothetical protein
MSFLVLTTRSFSALKGLPSTLSASVSRPGRRVDRGDLLAAGPRTKHCDQPPLRIPPETVGSFCALDERRSIAIQIDFRDVRNISLSPEDAAAVEKPDRSLGTLHGIRDELDVCAGGHDAGDRRRDDVLRRRGSLFPATAATATPTAAATTVLCIRDERNGRDDDERREDPQIADPWSHDSPPID